MMNLSENEIRLKLQCALDDPMWSQHAEVSKDLLRGLAGLLHQLQAQALVAPPSQSSGECFFGLNQYVHGRDCTIQDVQGQMQPDGTALYKVRVKPSSVAMTDALCELNSLEQLLDNAMNAYHNSQQWREDGPDPDDDGPTYLELIEAGFNKVRALLQSSPKGASTGTEPQDYETRHAIMEGERNAAVEAYIKARPQLDTIHNRRIYERGFQEGFERGLDRASPQEASKQEDSANSAHTEFDSNMQKVHIPSSQPSAASGRELPPFGWAYRPDNQRMRGFQFGENRPDERAGWQPAYLHAALAGAAPADANVGGQTWKYYFDVPDAMAEKALSARVPGGSAVRDWFLPHEHEKGKANVLAAMKCALFEVIAPTAPEPSAPADKVDAENYRYLRTKVCIIGLESGAYFDFINMPRPTYVAPDAAVELDAAIDRMRSESGKGGKL